MLPMNLGIGGMSALEKLKVYLDNFKFIYI